MSAHGSVPYRSAFFVRADHIERAEGGAFPASDALIADTEFFYALFYSRPYGSERDRDQELKKPHMLGTSDQFLLTGDQLCNLRDEQIRVMDPSSDLVLGEFGIGVIGDVVAWHLEISRAHVVKAFLTRQALCHGAADPGIASAGKDEIDVPVTFQRSIKYQFADKRRNLAHIYRHAYDERLLGPYRGTVVRLDPLKKIDVIIACSVSQFFGYESGVTCSTKI